MIWGAPEGCAEDVPAVDRLAPARAKSAVLMASAPGSQEQSWGVTRHRTTDPTIDPAKTRASADPHVLEQDM